MKNKEKENNLSEQIEEEDLSKVTGGWGWGPQPVKIVQPPIPQPPTLPPGTPTGPPGTPTGGGNPEN